MFEKAQNVDDVKDFVNEASNIIKTFDKNIVKENNEKLIKFIRDKKLDEYVDIPEETENLYEAIEYIVLNKKTYNNVNDFVKAQNVITEHITKNQKNNKRQIAAGIIAIILVLAMVVPMVLSALL